MTESTLGNAAPSGRSTAPVCRCAVPARITIAAAALAALQFGCGPRHSAAELKSFKDPYFPEIYTINFDECVYRIDASGDHHLAAVATHRMSDDSAEIRQFLDVRVYWKPVPGKTPSNSTTLDAMLRYAIQTPSGIAIYKGSGFVYLKKRRWSDKLIGRLEAGSLRLETQLGSAAEFIGDSTITATLIARPDSNRTIDLMREIELLSGAGLGG